MSKGLSRVFSNTTVQNHQFFDAQPSLWSHSQIHIHDYWKTQESEKSLSRVRLFVTPWSVACQASLSMGILQTRILEWGAIAFSERRLSAEELMLLNCGVGEDS